MTANVLVPLVIVVYLFVMDWRMALLSLSLIHIFDNEQNIIAVQQREFEQIYPQQGWVEHNPMEIKGLAGLRRPHPGENGGREGR